MRSTISRLRYLRSFMGTWGLAKHVLAKLISPVYYSEELAVTNGYITELVDRRETGPGAVSSEDVFTVEELYARRDRMHPDIDFAYLERFLREGSERARAQLKTIEDESGKRTYIGFSTNDSGEFRMPEYRFGGPLADHVEVGYEWELVPEYRGRGFSYRGGYSGHRLSQGRWLSTGVARTHNTPSVRSSERSVSGSIALIPGTFRLTRWFGGRWVKAPPWDEVRALMEFVPEGYTPPAIPSPEGSEQFAGCDEVPRRSE